MGEQSRKAKPGKTDSSRGGATRTALIEAAEELIGAHGLEGWSLRALGQAIESSNSNVVGYHFGDRDGLVRAIIRHRMPALEACRARLWAELSAGTGRQSLSEMANVIWRPFLEQVNTKGVHGYAALMASLTRLNREDLRERLADDFPVTNEVIAHTRSLLPGLSDAQFENRLMIGSVMCYATLVKIDQLGLDPQATEARFSDTIRMIAGALQAPLA